MANGYIHVIVKYAKNLPAADFNLLSLTHSSDPYCIVKLGERSRCTQTIQKSLNPVWKDMFSFRIGTRLSCPQRMVAFTCADLVPTDVTEETLEFCVFDEDVWKRDDFLGSNSVILAPILAAPYEWHGGELDLYPDEDDTQEPSTRGSIGVMILFEPRLRTSPYFLQILAVVLFWFAFALFLMAASCEWHNAQGVDREGMQQPGDSQALGLAAMLSFAGGLLQFAFAHMPKSFDAEHLLHQQDAGTTLPSDVALEEAKGSSNGDLLTVNLRPVSMSQTAIGVNSYIDIRLAVLVLGRLLITLPIGLAALPLLLEWYKDTLDFQEPGEIFDVSAIGCLMLGMLCLVCSNSRRKIFTAKKSTSSASAESRQNLDLVPLSSAHRVTQSQKYKSVRIGPLAFVRRLVSVATSVTSSVVPSALSQALLPAKADSHPSAAYKALPYIHRRQSRPLLASRSLESG